MFNIQNKLSWKIDFKSVVPEKNHIAWATAFVILFIATFYAYQVIDAYRNAAQISALVGGLKESAAERDWESSEALIRSINANASELEGDIGRMYPITLVPFVSQEAYSARSIIAAVKISCASALAVIDWAKGISVISEESFSSFSELSEKDKKDLLGQFAKSSELWDKVNMQTSLSLEFLEDAMLSTRLPIISSYLNRFSSKISSAQELFAQIQPWLAIAPDVLGYPNEKTYLLLLQNNTELRPTGGFIGTYGVLKVKNASVLSFMTDNVYNLDESAKVYNSKVPPLPLQKYIKQSQWFFRDVNWDPDFPTTAKAAIQFYKDERGPERNFDGVIAFTPDLIEDLLEVAGPVYVDDKEFTADNLIDTLAYHVEKGFKEEGITIYNRKQIIDDVAQQLKERLFSLSPGQMRSLAPLVLSALDERQLMFWFEDAQIQKIVENFNWSNRILPFSGDYAYVVDANLGSLKSDPAVNRSIKYSVSPDSSGRLKSILSITYEHTGDFDWKTTRYRTYTRVYVPKGSKFVNAKGNEEELVISDEHGKTVFGTFISIEPLATETLSFEYTLPSDLESRIKKGGYSLLIQKQAGTSEYNIEIDITTPFKIGSVSPEGIFKQKGSDQIIGKWNLQTDRQVSVMQK